MIRLFQQKKNHHIVAWTTSVDASVFPNPELWEFRFEHKPIIQPGIELQRILHGIARDGYSLSRLESTI
jgi:hypothetical protein